jgi:transcriptional regulator with XRE-family HTH domain
MGRRVEKLTTSQRVKNARLELGLSQVQLAAKAGVDPGTISRLERGVQGSNLETLRRIVDALDGDMREFVA